MFRYRYDTETGLYYLNSRYYNPEWERFINADDASILSADGELLGNNLFAYCTNDPVNNSDDNGYWKIPNWAKVAIGVAGIGIAVAATVATGGAALPALISATQIAIGSAAASGIIGGVFGYASGGWAGAKQGVINGASDGFALGALGAAGKAASVLAKVNIGTSFGKLGTLVKYQKIKVSWSNITTHAVERMAERGMSKSLIESVISNGKRLQQGANKFLYISKSGAVVIDNTGKIITAYGKNYFDDTMKSLVKKLF